MALEKKTITTTTTSTRKNSDGTRTTHSETSRVVTPAELRNNARLERSRAARRGERMLGSAPAILSFILVFLLTCNLFLVMTDNKDNLVSFEKFLNICGNAVMIDTAWLSHWGILDNIIISGDWGAFEFLRNFLNNVISAASSLIEVTSFLSTASINMFLFVTQFIGFIVIGS